MRDRQNLRLLFTLCALWMLLFIPLQSAIADVDNVITDNGGINETDPSDGSDESAGGGGEDVPWWEEAWERVVDVGSDWKDQLGEIGKDISNEWNDFLDSSEEVFSDVSDWFDTKWNEAGDWLNTKWNEAGDWIDQKWNEAGDWLDHNKWAQTLIAAAIATVVIVAVVAGLAALGVVGAISLAVVAVIAVGAIAGGFIYQWIAGDDYSFWGALGSSTVGGVLGYLGMATGAFASAWGWLRATAWPAVQGWVRNTAIPWITGKWQAGVNWARTVAFPFIRTKFTAGVNFVRTKFTAGMNWVRTVAFPWVRGKVMTGWNWIVSKKAVMARGMQIGFLAGSGSSILGNVLTSWYTGEELNLLHVGIDAIIGGISGALLAPFAVAGFWGITAFGIYGGLENSFGEYIKNGGDLFKPKEFIVGFVVSIASMKLLQPFLEPIFRNPVSMGGVTILDTTTKTIEEITKKTTDQIIKGIDDKMQEIETKNPSVEDANNKQDLKGDSRQDKNVDKVNEDKGVENQVENENQSTNKAVPPSVAPIQ